MDYKFIPALNYWIGWKRLPRLIVIHWTAGSFRGAIETFKREKASAHFIINTDGEVVQMVQLGDRAWHAGVSYTEEFGSNANQYSFGIELVGPPSLVGLKGWDPRQLDSCIEVIEHIVEHQPNVEYITDHSTISPGRKIDVKAGTGKACDVFPWAEFVKRSKLIEL